ncbi:hypothetical protein [Streptomyces sp. NPDC059009]|uniref:AfsR/SARP family transcriptional regulator n=1 Tax=Streptomyces sp. NPDC059009 TaxID=3346694 RepID=UPI0036C791D4
MAASIVVRRKRQIRYRPGSGARGDIPIAPVVRALRREHEQAVEPAVVEDDSTETQGLNKHVVGVEGGHALAWDLARGHGLGLVGPGATNAIRALLVSLLSGQYRAKRPQVEIVLPERAARLLLQRISSTTTPVPGLHVVASVAEALSLMEAELLTRMRSEDGSLSADADVPIRPEMVLVASADEAHPEERRLQMILDNGSTLGLSGVLLGQWRAGGTLRVRQDGTVAAASPPLGEAFSGARLFTLPPLEAQDLLDLLAEAAPGRPTSAEGGSAEALQSGTPPAGGTDEADDPKVSAYALRVSVLGRTQLTCRPHGTSQLSNGAVALPPKPRELLAYLALHRDGVRRETLTATLWPDAPRERPTNSFHAALSELRRALRLATDSVVTDITCHSDARYGLDVSRVNVDLWEFRERLKAARGSVRDESRRQEALRGAVDLYSGDFADDVTAEWAEAPREALRREYLDAVSELVLSVRDTDPRQALVLLERARELDRYNEALYRDIARMQTRLEEYDAVPRTFDLLRRTLAELDEVPSRATVDLFERLQNYAEQKNSHHQGGS